MQLFHVVGDATQPVKSPAIIAHVCNTVRAWGAGFVIPLGNAYPQAKQAYLAMSDADMQLGRTQFVEVGEVTVANMIAQKGIRPSKDGIPLRYAALHACLEEVQKRALEKGCTVSMPRIGAKRGGGDWNVIKAIIMATMKVDTYVYTLPVEAEDWPETKKAIPTADASKAADDTAQPNQ
jgi:O-acetyl-ADP-ribose deacetylase (regulator of RNase III)